MDLLTSTEEVEQVIEKLVTSGKQVLDQVFMKKLKTLCKHDDSCLEHCFHILMSQLLKEHSEIRYSAFQIIDELFVRSHLFRTLLLKNFHQFMDCTLETDFDNPLPPPKLVADKLKEDTLMAIKKWNEKYGIAYLKLPLAIDFLKHSKQIKFDQPRPTSRNFALEEKLSRKKIVNGMKLDKLSKDMEENIWETKNVTAEICSCLNLLVPLFTDSENSFNSNNQEKKEMLEGTGIPERGYSIEIDLAQISSIKITANADNKAILDHLNDLLNSTKRIHFPRLRQWLNAASKCGASPNILKNLIDVKVTLQNAVDKCNEMNIFNCESDEDEYDDFVEVPDLPTKPSTSKKLKVPKKNFYLNKKTLKTTNVWKPLGDEDSDFCDPTSYKFALSKQAKLLEKSKNSSLNKKQLQKVSPPSLKSVTSSTNNIDKLKEQAPTVSFDRDLLVWDAEKYKELKSTISLSGSKDLDVGHRFYGGHSASETDRGVSDAALSSITSRTIEFVGEFQPVTQSCKAPLPNGKLCPRQDRYKCPFHGKIIPRNALGEPLSKSDHAGTSMQDNVLTDIEFLQDVERNLGFNVSLIKKTKTRKKSENGLSDFKKIKDTSRSRLQRKVLSKKSLKRVAETMNDIDAKRNFDNFGNNFNYALN